MGVMALAGAALLSASMSVMPMPIAAFQQPADVSAPHVLAWASFLGVDTPVVAGTPWSSGATWTPVFSTWAEAGDAVVAAQAISTARLIGDVAAVGSGGRIVAIVSHTGGVSGAGVVAAASATGARRGLAAVVQPGGELAILSLTGGSSTTLAAGATVSEAAVEISLQIVGTTAIATARPLWSRRPTVVVTAELTAAVANGVAPNAGYGVIVDATASAAFSAVRVELGP